MHKSKILYIVNNADFFISHRLPIALAAKNEGYEIHIAAPLNNASKPLFLKIGFNFHEIYLEQYSLNLIKEFRAIYSINTLLLKLRPDLIHLITIKPIFYGAMFSSILGIPSIIVSFTGLGHIHSSKNLKMKILCKLIFTFFHFIFNRSNLCVIFQNPDDQRFFLKNKIIKKNQSCLIKGSGVDINKFNITKKEPRGALIVMMASRMLWSKGLLDFIEASKKFKERETNVRFVLIGKPESNLSYGANLKTLKEFHKNGVVEWWGYKDDMHKIINQAHIFCLPSKYGEGVPKVLIEAAACGKPLVASNIAGCREIVVDGLNGYLFEPGNVESIINSLEPLILSSRLRQKMGLKSRAIAVSEFSVSFVINKTIEKYKKYLH